MHPERQHLHNELDKALDQLEQDPKFVQGFTLRQWDALTKDNEGEAHIHKLGGFVLNVLTENQEPLWEPVRRVESGPISFNTEPAQSVDDRIVIIPDVQAGFWEDERGKLTPMHCEKTIDVGLQIIEKVKPSEIVLLGDLLDFPAFSKYPQTPEFARTTNASIEYAHNLLKTIREIGGSAMKMTLLAGNHEKRLPDAIKRNFMAAYGIKRAGESVPVMSVPYLLALDQLDVGYIDAYPAGRHHITPTLACAHGTISKKGATANMLSSSEGISTIQAHNHRLESYARTMNIYNGARQTYAYSAGTWSRIDGAVPSVGGALEGQYPTKRYEDWQNGMMVVDRIKGKDWFAHLISLDLKHRTSFEGVLYSPRTKAQRKREA